MYILKLTSKRGKIMTEQDLDYGFDYDDAEDLMNSFQEAMMRINQEKDYLDKEDQL